MHPLGRFGVGAETNRPLDVEDEKKLVFDSEHCAHQITERARKIRGCRLGKHRVVFENVADAIRGRAEPAVKPEEARDTVRVIELAFQSSAERRVVPFESSAD